MKKRIVSIMLAMVLVCTLAAGAQAALLGSAGISLKDDGTGIELLDDFDPNKYEYEVQVDTWTNTLTLTLDDANAIVYTNAGTGIVNEGAGVFTVNLAPLGSATGITVMTGGKTYNIKCSKKPVGPSASITSFGYKKADNPSLLYDVIGIIDEYAQTITLNRPVPADVALKASFTHNGAELRLNGLTQESGVTEQSFGDKHQLLYYLVANDGLDAVYSVVNLPTDLPEPADKTALDELIAEAKEKNEEDYVVESWEAFAEALENAKSVSADDDATQDEVDAAVEALRSAMDALEETGKVVEVTSVKIGGAAIQQVRIRKTQQFTATINPTDATDKTLAWTSSNEKIFTVDDNGLVAGVGTGSAKLTVTSSNGKTHFIMISITA